MASNRWACHTDLLGQDRPEDSERNKETEGSCQKFANPRRESGPASQNDAYKSWCPVLLFLAKFFSISIRIRNRIVHVQNSKWTWSIIIFQSMSVLKPVSMHGWNWHFQAQLRWLGSILEPLTFGFQIKPVSHNALSFQNDWMSNKKKNKKIPYFKSYQNRGTPSMARNGRPLTPWVAKIIFSPRSGLTYKDNLDMVREGKQEKSDLQNKIKVRNSVRRKNLAWKQRSYHKNNDLCYLLLSSFFKQR